MTKLRILIEHKTPTQNSQFYKIEKVLNFIDDKIENIDWTLPTLQNWEDSQFCWWQNWEYWLNTWLPMLQNENILNFVDDKIENIDWTHNS